MIIVKSLHALSWDHQSSWRCSSLRGQGPGFSAAHRLVGGRGPLYGAGPQELLFLSYMSQAAAQELISVRMTFVRADSAPPCTHSHATPGSHSSAVTGQQHNRRTAQHSRNTHLLALPRWHRPRLYLSVIARQGGFRRALLALHDGLCSATLFSGSAVRARVYGSLVIMRSPPARSLPPAWVSSS
jgi:hypothetical protein